MAGKKSANGAFQPEALRRKGTAQEVARRAEVSVMTVSRVFSGSPRVSKKTRERVFAIAGELGYQPNLAARALRTGRLDTIGFLLWSHDALRGQFHSESLAGFESIVGNHGLHVNLAIPSPEEPMPVLADRLVRSGRCGGLVIQSDELPGAYLESLRAIGAPLVLMNYAAAGAEELGLSVVGYDNRRGIEHAVRHLSALGHRRIAFIGGTPRHHDHIQRELGFREAIERLNIELNEEWVRPGDFQRAFEEGAQQTDYLLAQIGATPTAVVCASDETALGAMASARRCGRHVPDDLSVVGFDNINVSAYLDPPLTTVDHNGWELGLAVADVILKLIDDENPTRRPIRRMMETRLLVRQSTARPRHPSRD